MPLSAGKVEYFSAAFFLRNPLAGGLRQDQVSIIRERFVGEGMQDTFVVENQGMDPVEFELTLDEGSSPGEEGSGDKRVQAYNFRICLTDVKENQIPLAKPSGYHERDYELKILLLPVSYRERL